MDRGKVRFVLHRPSSAENVGAAARALKNFGFGRLAVVAPPAWAGLPRTGGEGTAREDVLARARRLARRAADVLERAEIHGDLRAAVGAATWVCGTTSRTIEGRPQLDPRALAVEVARRTATGEVAVVFGEERRGLSDAELALCDAVCTIPTDGAYDSMNLAQAVAVIAYELGRAPPPAAPPPAEPARRETVEALFGALRVLLARAGYLNPQNPDAILAEWRRILGRAEPTQREVELLAAAVRAVDRLVRERDADDDP
jgi:tRNA/rRNA methyltransferase